MRIGFIGLGDVGSRFSSGIVKESNADAVGYDKKFGLEEFSEKEARCKEHNVAFAYSMEELVKQSDILISATSCAEAIETAEEALPYLREGQYYIDVNSAVPEIKRRVRDLVETSGARFVDGGIMGSPLNGWHKAPIVMSGPQAQFVVDALKRCGMNIKNVGSEVGQASSLKILRSIFTKGLESLLIESLSSAYAYGVMEEVLSSIIHILTKEPLEDMFGRMICTDVVHAKRRALEVGAVADMLEAAGRDCTMSRASFEKLMWSSKCGVKERFDSKTPDDFREVIRYFASLQHANKEGDA